jgi:murein DD-endopeptidase MepM/ murein hydrolase activator NlpD
MRALICLLLAGCATGSPYERQVFKKEGVVSREARLPFSEGTRFLVRQGAFGRSSHSEPENEYAWDLEVPLGTSVLAVEDGVVLDLYLPQPEQGGCDSKFVDSPWNMKVEHADGTVAQYMHVHPRARFRVGERVKRGDVIAETAANGWFCYPHLHFGMYRSRNHLYSSHKRESIPVLFRGVPEGILREGLSYEVGRP